MLSPLHAGIAVSIRATSRGSAFFIRLSRVIAAASRRQTGYRWHTDVDDPARLQLLTDHYEGPNPSRCRRQPVLDLRTNTPAGSATSD